MALLNGEWCRSIATMLASGLTPVQVFTTIQQQVSTKEPFYRVCQQAIPLLESGLSLVEVLYELDCLSAYHYQLLKVAEYSGQLSTVFIQIAHQLERSQQRNQRLKIQLRVSQAIISIGLLAHLLLSLFKQQFPIIEMVFFIALLTITRFILNLINANLFSVLAWIWQSRFAQKISIFTRFFEYYLFRLLLIQWQSGIDPEQGLAQLQLLFANPSLKQKIRLSQAQIAKGAALTTTLTKHQLILSSHLKQVMQIGETAGRLTDHLAHYLQQEEKYLALVIESIYEWLPRFYYLLAIVALMNYVF